MSRETLNWLNSNTLIGFTEKRGNAWHYRAEEQGAESNHYPHAIPIEEVKRRLFNWQAVEGQISATALTDTGVLSVTDADRKAIMRGDTGAILGIFKQGYQPHQYDAWLLDTVSSILDSDLSIGSAGLLRGGGVAWVSVEVPDSIVTPSGVEFRPNLLAATSLDGTLSTTFKRCVTNVVCDNTMAAGLGEQGQQVKVKHSRYSHARLGDIREALAIVHTVGEEFARQVEELTNTHVSAGDWSRFLDSLAPIPEAVSTFKPGRAHTMAVNKREKLQNLYDHDNRVTPWRGTAYGVVQCVNTYAHHVANASKTGAARAESNMLNAITGATDKMDNETLRLLQLAIA